MNLSTAGNFAILSKTTITDTPPSAITGNVGVSPASGSFIHVTCAEVNGTIYSVDAAGPLPCRVTNDTLLTAAVSAMEAAYTDAAGRVNGTGSPDYLNEGAGTLTGLTLYPGIHKWTTGVTIPTDVNLSGNLTDVWIFQIAGTLSIDSAMEVILSGGAQAGNVFWAVAGTTTLGTTSVFNGNILGGPAASTIAIQTGATLNGRALGQTDVTLDHANVSLPTGAKADQTITFSALPNRTYGEPDFGVSATATSGLPVSFSASGNCTVTTGTVHITGAGSCTITASQAGDGTYNAAPDVPQTFAINRKAITVTAASKTKVYGEADPALNYTANESLVGSDSFSGALARDAGEDLGTYNITQNTLSAGSNYDLTFVGGTLTIMDNVAPVITLAGATPVTIEVHGNYTDAGATATDNYDGNLTGSIVTNNSVNQDVVGNYTVTYDVVDANGNHAVQAVRVVNVADTTAPVIAAHANETAEATSPAGAAVTYTTPSATDNYDPEVAVNCTPLSGSTFALGSTAVNCTASDAAGNNASSAFTVTVADTIAPSVNAGTDKVTNVAATQNATVSDATAVTYFWNASSAAVHFSNASVEDPEVSATADGTYTLNLTVTDAGSNHASGTASFTWDTTKPAVTSVDSDNQSYNSLTPSPRAITVTFSENISVSPTMAVNGSGQTVTNCGDTDARTFCFNYTIPASILATETINVSGAQDAATNTMVADSTHTFNLDTVAPAINASINVAAGNSQILVGAASPAGNITLSPAATNVALNASALYNGSIFSLTLPSPIGVNASTTLGNVILQIPANLTMSASSDWAGVCVLPTVQNTPITYPNNLGTNTVTGVVEICVSGTAITFDKAVRILIPGKAGQNAGFVRGGTFTQITAACTADTQAAGNALAAGADCVTSSGSDMVIWTKHFTQFMSYTTYNPSSSGGSSNSGGGSTGAGAPSTTKSTSDYPVDVGLGKYCTVSLTREISSTDSLSVLTSTIVNKGDSGCTMYDFVFMDTIPDTFAAMNEITFSPAASSQVGWTVSFSFPQFAPGESEVVTYSVSRRVPTSRVEAFTSASFAARKEALPGSDRDEHGCIPSAGYTWCEAKQKCLRTWEENCTAVVQPTTPTQPAKPPATPELPAAPPTAAQPSIDLSGIALGGVALAAIVAIAAVAWLVLLRKKKRGT